MALIFSIAGFSWAGSFSLVAIMIMASHAIIEYTIIIYYIRPYRVFIKKIAYHIFKKEDTHVSTVGPTMVVLPLTVVPQTVASIRKMSVMR